MLVRLLYASRPTTPVTDELLSAILARSHDRNPAQGITGVLCHTTDLFVQVLEGGREPVNALYRSIVVDPRHREVQVLCFDEIAERRFTNWTMGRVNLAKVNPALLLRYSERAALDPFTLSGRVSMALLEDLISAAAVVGR